MVSIFAGQVTVLFALAQLMTPVKPKAGRGKAAAASRPTWLPPAATHPSKRWGELFALSYAAVWIGAVVVVIALSLYEHWGPWGYMAFCGGCALPLFAYPLAFPPPADAALPWHARYTTKANLWVAIFSFVGNYWYTHYFYHVLGADYTFEAHRLNDVPICLYLMTHPYFMLYHAMSNAALRRVRTGYEADRARLLFEAALVACMSYGTAFMEALTICGFPYYRFEDRHMAYTVGSAFYGIYFLVSFPMFIRVDEDAKRPFTLFQAGVEALATSMAVLILLDAVRLALGVPLFRDH